MLYYCVWFEASSLVISGQPFCFFPLNHITAPQFCTVYLFDCAVLFSCTINFKHRLIFFTCKVSWKRPQFFFPCFFLTSSHCPLFSALSKPCARNSELSVGVCPPGQCHYYLECLFWSVLCWACNSVSVVYAWNQPKSILCVPYAYKRASVQSKSISIKSVCFVLLNHKLKGICCFACRFPDLRHCSEFKICSLSWMNSLTFWEIFTFSPRVSRKFIIFLYLNSKYEAKSNRC